MQLPGQHSALFSCPVPNQRNELSSVLCVCCCEALIKSPTDSLSHPSHNLKKQRRTGSDRMRATGSASSYPARARGCSLSHCAAHTRSFHPSVMWVVLTDLRPVKNLDSGAPMCELAVRREVGARYNTPPHKCAFCK